MFLHKMVVFPALSSPKMRIRTSLDPKRVWNIRLKKIPMFAQNTMKSRTKRQKPAEVKLASTKKQLSESQSRFDAEVLFNGLKNYSARIGEGANHSFFKNRFLNWKSVFGPSSPAPARTPGRVVAYRGKFNHRFGWQLHRRVCAVCFPRSSKENILWIVPFASKLSFKWCLCKSNHHIHHYYKFTLNSYNSTKS